MEVKTIIFDLGGVLIDWNPRHLYRKIYDTEEEIDWFLKHICTSEWNEQQDAGRSFADATEELLAKFPEHEVPIRAWYGRWQETINGSINGTVEILRAIKDSKKFRLYALTNWSAESFPWAFDNFEFLRWFDGIVVSGVEKTRKPFPEFYQILLDRYQIDPADAVFIDDSLRNVEGGEAMGIKGIHFKSPDELKTSLHQVGVVI